VSIYIYIYMVCARVRVCACVRACVRACVCDVISFIDVLIKIIYVYITDLSLSLRFFFSSITDVIKIVISLIINVIRYM